MQQNLLLQFTIFTLIAVGFLVRKLNLVSEQGQKGLTNLVVYVILPANSLRAFFVADLSVVKSQGLWVLGISIAIQIFGSFYSRLVFRRETEAQKKSLRLATICSNSGFLGNPLAEGIYGADGLSLANIYVTPVRVILWSAGLAIFTGSHDWKASLKKTLTHPCILAILLGVPGMLLRLQLPELLMKPLTALSNCNTAASMMVIGMILSRVQPKELLDKSVLHYALHRLIIIPAIVYAACLPLPISPMARGLCVILAAMPAPANTSILADMYNQDPLYATRLVVVSTLLSIPTTAIWCAILT